MKNLLILGSGGNAGINFIRSLSKDNELQSLRVYGTDIDPFFIHLSPCESFLLQLDTKEQQLDNIIEKYKIDFIHAQPDAEVKFLLERKKYSSLIFNHSLEKWHSFSDKQTCQQIWTKNLNLNFNVSNFTNIKEEDFSLYTQNTGKAWIRANKGAGSKAALPVTTYEQAYYWIKYWVENKNLSFDDFCVSEFLPNEEYAVQTFWNDGELLHSQARQRLRYVFENIMPSGQSSTPSLTKTISKQNVYDIAHKAIKLIDKTPHGIYCIDMKTNFEGDIVPTEVNYGRFFTTSNFFASLGVNTPALYVKNFFAKTKEYKINSLSEDIYLIRGLDIEPIIRYANIS